jgi:hypothetical protein
LFLGGRRHAFQRTGFFARRPLQPAVGCSALRQKAAESPGRVRAIHVEWRPSCRSGWLYTSCRRRASFANAMPADSEARYSDRIDVRAATSMKAKNGCVEPLIVIELADAAASSRSPHAAGTRVNGDRVDIRRVSA